MSVLQFISSMTGHLAWPLAAVTLGLIFRQQIKDLMKRLRRLTWRESTAELVEAAEDVQASVEAAVSPLPSDDQASEQEREQERRRRIERLMQDSFRWGFWLSKHTDGMPDFKIDWRDDQPVIGLRPTLLTWYQIRQLSRKASLADTSSEDLERMYCTLTEELHTKAEKDLERLSCA